MEHLADFMCTDDARSARLGCDDNPVTQTRDWNEEIQATRELLRQNLPERLLRDRTIFKVHSDFVMTAIRGAEAVVDGNVMAINPGEDSRSQMFVWNNLFFSLGFDVRDHYKALGGDAAAHAAPALDLAGVRAFASLDVEAICCLGTTIVDYRGYRVTAQSVVPGILEREQRQAVTYGSLDFGETVQGSRKIVSLLERSSKPLHVLRHKVLNEKDEEVELVSSVECKGIVGNDGRHYILDLLRTFPPDANFLPPLPGEDPLPDDAFPEPCKHFGFPRPYRHRLVSLRPELVEAFTRAKYEDFMKLAIAKHKSQLEGNADGFEEKEMDNREVIRNACNAVGSVSDCFFDIRFNPDVFTPTVRFPESECESVERQKLLHREASAFLLSHQIPAFLKESLDHSAVILDGATLIEFMHRFGINVRYLGTVVRALEEQEERDCNRLHFLHRLLVTEIIVRAAKHLFRTYLQVRIYLYNYKVMKHVCIYFLCL
uniref:Clu domain-containing protein n=1 Tax=Eptatretus burgeri TaxID=7764 RepID=A0A8C4R4E9_EPTBU